MLNTGDERSRARLSCYGNVAYLVFSSLEEAQVQDLFWIVLTGLSRLAFVVTPCGIFLYC